MHWIKDDNIQLEVIKEIMPMRVTLIIAIQTLYIMKRNPEVGWVASKWENITI